MWDWPKLPFLDEPWYDGPADYPIPYQPPAYWPLPGDLAGGGSVTPGGVVQPVGTTYGGTGLSPGGIVTPSGALYEPVDPKPQWKDVLGDPEKPTDYKLPTDDFGPSYVRTPKTVADGTDPKSVVDSGTRGHRSLAFKPQWKDLVGDPKAQWKDATSDPSPKLVIGDPKNVYDPKNIVDPVKMAAYDTGGWLDPGRLVRRPFVLGTPHHAASAAAMAGADPSAMALLPSQYATDAEMEAAMLESAMDQLEAMQEHLEHNLDALEEQYQRLHDRYDDLDIDRDADEDAGDEDPETDDTTDGEE